MSHNTRHSSDNSAFHFQTLTPDAILNCIESLGIYPETGLIPLNSFENRVYQFRSDRAERYVVKFYRPERWSDAQILEEHAFAIELAEAELPTAVPLSLDGQTLHHAEGLRFALFPSLGGRPFEVDNLEQLEAAGHLVGRLHQQAAMGQFQQREHIGPHFAKRALPVLAASTLIPSHLQEALLSAAGSLADTIAQHWVHAKQLRLHGDLHPGNMLWMPDGPGVVDLDDALTGPAIQDLWMLLAGDDHDKRLQLDILISAYEEFHDFDPRELKLIEPLRGIRMLHHMAWVLRRWEDPAFPQHFPWFADEAFWQRQCRELEAQRLQILAPPLSLQPF